MFDPGTDEAAAELFKALASPPRLRILRRLGAGAACVHELVTATGASQSLVSQHLRVLRGARLVHGERRGREVYYTLVDDHIAHVVEDAMAHVREPHHIVSTEVAELGDEGDPGDHHLESESLR